LRLRTAGRAGGTDPSKAASGLTFPDDKITFFSSARGILLAAAIRRPADGLRSAIRSRTKIGRGRRNGRAKSDYASMMQEELSMKYACLVYIDARIMGALSKEEDVRLTDATVEADWDLRQRGHLILAQPLQPPETAVTIRVRNGRPSRTDGPFAETKEFLGGFYLIEARHMDEAVRIAEEDPMASMGSVEIRPFLEQKHSVTGKGRPELRNDS
jgi:hypothetical protein